MFKLLLPGLKEPAPPEFHIPLPEPFTIPVKETDAELEHNAWLAPALTVAKGDITRFIVFVTAAQGLLLPEVSVNVTSPDTISAVLIK